MRVLSLLLLLSVTSFADQRNRMIAAILDTDAGTIVKLQLTDGARVGGRLHSVNAQSITLDMADAGSVATREIPFDRIRSFRARKPNGVFSREFKTGAGRTLGGLAVFFGVVLLLAAIGAAAN